MDEKTTKRVKALISNSLNTSENKSNYICINKDRVLRGSSKPAGVVEDHPEDFQLDNKHTELLIKLSQQLSESGLKDFHVLLLTYLTDNYKQQLVQAVTLYFVHTRRIKMLIEAIDSTLGHDSGNSAEMHSISGLVESMQYRPDLFQEDDAEFILDWCSGYYSSETKRGGDRINYRSLYRDTDEYIDRLQEKANEIFTRHFARQIDTAYNPELNVDEAKVIEVIEVIGFPLDLSESLRHIDNLVQEANEPMKYRDAMAAIRVYTERLYEQIAREIDPHTKIDGKDSEKCANYFLENKLVSTDMAELIKAHRHFLSNDGTHRIKSRREDARIGKNMTIELSLYLLTRLREHQSIRA
ncbi:MAG TPA: hypothetical protein VL362_01425 [Patescibacteria group bacterium]|jgi:hypothetical protein|nr:hypothetical protein [Patescibacteria group bacterium]